MTKSAVLFLFLHLFLYTAPASAEDYDKDTVLDDAMDFFGDGAEGLGQVVEKIFKELGRPNAIIKGEEASAAFTVGARYGSGQLRTKKGGRTVHWTGPSIGFDVGANAVKTFALVYNIYDTEEMFGRIGAVEGSAYYVGGLGISAYGGGTKTVVMIRLGVGLRLQASLGYINFTKKRKIIPF